MKDNFKYYIFKYKQNSNEYLETIEEFASAYFKSYQIKKDLSNSMVIVIVKNITIEEINNLRPLLLELNLEMQSELQVLESRLFASNIELESCMEYSKKAFNSLEIPSSKSYLDEKTFVRIMITKGITKELKEFVFGKYTKDKETLYSMKVFLECNMNTSKASELLYLHRNTLIHRLDRFYEQTGYNLKEFQDAYIIYSLLNTI